MNWNGTNTFKKNLNQILTLESSKLTPNRKDEPRDKNLFFSSHPRHAPIQKYYQIMHKQKWFPFYHGSLLNRWFEYLPLWVIVNLLMNKMPVECRYEKASLADNTSGNGLGLWRSKSKVTTFIVARKDPLVFSRNQS